MMTLKVTIFFFLAITTERIAAGRDWGCPLELRRPPSDSTLASLGYYLDPLDYLIALPDDDPDKLCPKWKKHLVDAKAKILDFYNQVAHGPVPPDRTENVRLAAESLSKILIELGNAAVTGDGVCKDKISEEGRSAVLNVVRSLYAADERIRKYADAAAIGLTLPENTLKFYNDLRKALGEQIKVNDRNFVKDACNFLEKERERRCSRVVGRPQVPLARPSASQQSDARAVWKKLNSRVNTHFSKMDKSIGRDPIWRKLLVQMKVTKPKEKIDVSTDWGAEDYYYEYVVPMLKMCGVYYALDRGTGDSGFKSPFVLSKAPAYADACKPFSCGGHAFLVEPASPPDPNKPDRSFCGYLEDYPNIEERYLAGFKDLLRSGRKDLSFCPAPPPGAGRVGGRPIDH